MLPSSDGISSWTPLKPQHSNLNPNPKPLANQLWCIDFLTPPKPLIIPHRLSAFLESVMPLKNWCSIHARWFKSSLKNSIRFCDIFSKFKKAQRLLLWDNWGDERGCDKGHGHAHTRGFPWGLPEVFGMVEQVHCSWRRLLWRGLEFHVCTINKSAHTKKVWKLI